MDIIKGLNMVVLCGELGSDPELKYVGQGNPTPKLDLRLKVTTDRRINDRWEPRTEWHTVIAWGERAEQWVRELRKGMVVTAVGELRNRSWDTPEGKRYRTEVVIHHAGTVVVGGMPFVAAAAARDGGQGAASAAGPAESSSDGGGDDIPF